MSADDQPPGPLAGTTVLVPRSADQAGGLAERLRALGAEPVEAPTILIHPTSDPQALSRALEGGHDWVALTSPNAVEAVVGAASDGALEAARLAVVGSGTRAALAAHGHEADLVPERSTARGLAEALIAAAAEPGRVLLPRSDVADSALPRALEDADWQVEEVEAYRTVPVRELPEGVAEDLRAGRIDAVALSSGSTAHNLLALLGGLPDRRVRIATIGPSTSAVCEGLGLRVAAEADPHDLDGLAAAVVEAV